MLDRELTTCKLEWLRVIVGDEPEPGNQYILCLWLLLIMVACSTCSLMCLMTKIVPFAWLAAWSKNYHDRHANAACGAVSHLGWGWKVNMSSGSMVASASIQRALATHVLFRNSVNKLIINVLHIYIEVWCSSSASAPVLKLCQYTDHWSMHWSVLHIYIKRCWYGSWPVHAV